MKERKKERKKEKKERRDRNRQREREKGEDWEREIKESGTHPPFDVFAFEKRFWWHFFSFGFILVTFVENNFFITYKTTV